MDVDIVQLAGDGAGAGEGLNMEGASGMTAAGIPEISDGPFACLQLAGLL